MKKFYKECPIGTLRIVYDPQKWVGIELPSNAVLVIADLINEVEHLRDYAASLEMQVVDLTKKGGGGNGTT